MNRIGLTLFFCLAGCGGGPPTMMPPVTMAPTTSSSIALTSDDGALWVVNPDADSVSVINPKTRALVSEILLGAARPAPDATGRYEPAVKPRALAILAGDKKVYVAGETANRVYVIDAQSLAVLSSIPV